MLASGSYDQAAAALIRGYGPRIIGYMRAILRDPGLADDAFSHFGEKVWRGMAAFRNEGSVLAWAYTIAWSSVCRVAESGYQRRRTHLDTDDAERIVAEVRTATSPYQDTANKDAIVELRARLAPDEQTLLFLRVDQNLPWTDIAKVMDVDAATLRKRFERIKDKLRMLAHESGLLQE